MPTKSYSRISGWKKIYKIANFCLYLQIQAFYRKQLKEKLVDIDKIQLFSVDAKAEKCSRVEFLAQKRRFWDKMGLKLAFLVVP